MRKDPKTGVSKSQNNTTIVKRIKMLTLLWDGLHQSMFSVWRKFFCFFNKSKRDEQAQVQAQRCTPSRHKQGYYSPSLHLKKGVLFGLYKKRVQEAVLQWIRRWRNSGIIQSGIREKRKPKRVALSAAETAIVLSIQKMKGRLTEVFQSSIHHVPCLNGLKIDVIKP